MEVMRWGKKVEWGEEEVVVVVREGMVEVLG